jgi:autophagy-related protein 101
MENQLASALLRIVVLTQKTDHIPPITTNEANPFPYQVYSPFVSTNEDRYS